MPKESWEYRDDRPDVWTWVQAWYVAQCNNDWEHQLGIKIGTIDNPGWSVAIDLERTPLQDRPWPGRRAIHRSEDDWCETWIENGVFEAACGPLNLAEALHEFRAWATD